MNGDPQDESDLGTVRASDVPLEHSVEGGSSPKPRQISDAFLGKVGDAPLVYFIMHLCKGDGGGNGILK